MLTLVAPPAILVSTLLVPLAFRRLWPGGDARPRLFLIVTLTLALAVAAVAAVWFAQVLVGIGIAGGSGRTADSSPLFAAELRTRFLTAAVCAVLAQYWVCRGTQYFLGR